MSEPDDEAFEALLKTLASAPEPLAYTLIGQQIGRFEVRAGLGRGGMGEVYRAYDPSLGRDVALKVLHAGSGTANLLDEARAAARLVSPHIPPIYDVIEHDGRPVIALELCTGPTLAALLFERSLTPAEVTRIARGVARALKTAHEAGVVHRDVKPGNILLRPDGHPLLVDFSLASAAGDVDAIEGGTLTYCAPEQKSGDAPQASADVFSFGVVLQEMLKRSSAPARSLLALAQHCQATDPKLRHADGAALLAALLAAEPKTNRRLTKAKSAAIVIAVLAVGMAATLVPFIVDATSPKRPPSIESVPTVTAHTRAQRSFMLAVQAFYAGDREAAARALLPVLHAEPTRASPWVMAILLRQANLPKGAEIERRLRLSIDNDVADAKLARLALAANALHTYAPGQQVPAEKARALFQGVHTWLDAHPQSWFESLLLILILPRTTDAHERLVLLQKLQAMDADPPLLGLTLSWTFQHLGKKKAAREVLETAARNHQGNDAVATELATLALDDGDPARAKAEFKALAKRRPSDAILRFNLAEADLRLDGQEWPTILDTLLGGGFDPVLVGRGTLFLTEAVAAQGRLQIVRPYRERALVHLADIGAIQELTGGLSRLLIEAAELREWNDLAHWWQKARQLKLRLQIDDATTVRVWQRLETVIDVTEAEHAIFLADREGLVAVVARLLAKSDDEFPPDLGRARTLARLEAYQIALGQAKSPAKDGGSRALATLKRALVNLPESDLARVPPSFRRAQLHLLLGDKVSAQQEFSTALDREQACLAATLYWELRCRRDLLRARVALISLDQNKASEHRQAVAALLHHPDDLYLLRVARMESNP